MEHIALKLLLLLAVVRSSLSCVFLYGDRGENKAPEYNYDFCGDDWPQVDTSGLIGSCGMGGKQSPIDIPAQVDGLSRLGKRRRASFKYGKFTSTGKNLQVINNGQTVQVQWTGPVETQVTVKIPGSSVKASGHITDVLSTGYSGAKTTPIKLNPIQFHFHARSEHTVGGVLYPLELHIVHTVDKATLGGCIQTVSPNDGSCYAVLGVFFHIVDDNAADTPSTEMLDLLFRTAPYKEGETAYLPAGASIDLDMVLPKDRSYVTYEGSLTTPPCSSRVLWHVLTKPIAIKNRQLIKFQQVIGDTICLTNTALSSFRFPPDERVPVRRLLGEGTITGGEPEDKCFKLGGGKNYRHLQSSQGNPLYYVRSST